MNTLLTISLAVMAILSLAASYPHPLLFEPDAELYGSELGYNQPYGDLRGPHTAYDGGIGWPGVQPYYHRRRFHQYRRHESPYYFHRNGIAHYYPPIAVLAGWMRWRWCWSNARHGTNNNQQQPNRTKQKQTNKRTKKTTTKNEKQSMNMLNVWIGAVNRDNNSIDALAAFGRREMMISMRSSFIGEYEIEWRQQIRRALFIIYYNNLFISSFIHISFEFKSFGWENSANWRNIYLVFFTAEMNWLDCICIYSVISLVCAEEIEPEWNRSQNGYGIYIFVFILRQLDE